MTVEVQDPFNSYTAAPGATVFTYEFKIVSSADLIATIDDIVIDLGIDFSLSGVGSNDGGDLTLFVPLSGGQEVLLKRQMTFNRETDYQQNGDFNAPVVNNDFDRIWLAMQQLGQDLKRSIKVAFTETTDQTIPISPAARANKALVFDASGNVTASADNYNDQAADAAASAAAAAVSETAVNAAAAEVETDRLAADVSAQAAAASAASINPSNLIHTTGNETKSGVLTFTQSPILPGLNGGQLAGFRNRLINGDFSINQRVVTGSVVLAAGAYGHDRWKAGAAGCTYTFSTVLNITTLTITAGSLIQVIEGLNLQSGTYVLSWSGTAQGKIGAGASGASGVSGVITGGTNTNVEFGTGTLSRVQLELGTVATPFEQRYFGTELSFCQRYAMRWDSLTNINTVYAVGYAATASSLRAVFSFPQKMRVVPTMTSSAGTNFESPGVVGFTGSLAFSNLSVSGFVVSATTASAILNIAGAYPFGTANNVDAYIMATAEL